MIPALMIWLCKKYLAPRFRKKRQVPPQAVLKRFVVFMALSFLITDLYAQQYKFNIKRNESVIGQLYFQQKEEGDNLFLQITSKVNTRFLFKIDVETEDIAHFKNGKLLTSGVFRTVNGNVKAARKTNWINSHYETLAGDQTGSLKGPICYNMMMLYNREPVNISQIYSDYFHCFLPVKKNRVHEYRIDLPDGNYNEYHFENGICRLIIVNHSMYTIKMERV